MTQTEKFKYSISKTDGILVACFAGVLNFEGISDFHGAIKEIFSEPSIRFIAVDFFQVQNITMDAIPAFLQFQKIARDRKQDLRLCGMNEDLKEKLLKLGVVRRNELSVSLREAVVAASQVYPISESQKKAC